jgi:hypothetical protein
MTGAVAGWREIFAKLEAGEDVTLVMGKGITVTP